MDSKDATKSSSTTSIPKKDKADTNPRVAFGKGARNKSQKSCELCKVMKGVDNPAWKTHITKDCRSKDYHKKRMKPSHKYEPPYKKTKPTVRLV